MLGLTDRYKKVIPIYIGIISIILSCSKLEMVSSKQQELTPILTINSVPDVISGKTATISGKLTDQNGTPLTDQVINISLGETGYTTSTDSVGEWTFITPELLVTGTFTVEAKYFYNEAQASISVSTSFNVVVAPVDPSEAPLLSINSVADIHHGETVNVTGTLTDDNMHALADKTINITINGVSYTTTTNALGEWSWISDPISVVREYTVEARYFYTETSSVNTSTSFRVLKLDPEMSVDNPQEVVEWNGSEQCTNYSVHLPEDATGKISVVTKNSVGGTVHQHNNINVAGGTIEVDSCATTPETYTSTITYSGDSKYNSISTAVQVLRITPVEGHVTVTITERSGEVGYDGTEHCAIGYDVSISDPLYTTDDFTFSGIDSACGTNAGSYAMELSAGDFENTNPLFADVEFVIVNGQMVINLIDVTVNVVGNNSSVDYDGNEHNVSGYTATSSNPLYNTLSDVMFSGSAEASRTEVGTTYMGLNSSMFVNTNLNFAVTFNIVDGYIKIN